MGDREDARFVAVVRIRFVLAVRVRCRVLMIGGFVIIVMVIADVKMEVEETGARFAVVMPVVCGVQTEAHDAHSTDEQQAGAG